MRVDFTGRSGLLTATGGHPYARYSLTDDHTVGEVGNDCVVWLSQRANGPVVTALGDPAEAWRIAEATPSARLDLPRLPAGHGEDWEFRWTHQSKPIDDPRVAELMEADWPEVTDLLRAELSYTGNWPGNPGIHAWYGIREDGRLVAVAADRSRFDVGYLVAVAVAGDRRRQGLAKALVGTLTSRLLSRYDVCALAVYAHNAQGTATFTALGYVNTTLRTMVHR